MIGGHLVERLLDEGFEVRAVDRKPIEEWQQVHETADNWQRDLQVLDNCREQCEDMEYVYNLAADMGGMGFIETHKVECMLSVLASTHMLVAADEAGVRRFFYASSACVYPDYRQLRTNGRPLNEADAYPAEPEDGYGWEKLFTERMCRHFREDRDLQTRVARYHNVFGPHGEYDGGREKAPAALCRKVAEAVLQDKGEITIWGDGYQTRSFLFIDDCIEGTRRLMDSEHPHPLNIGSEELVAINELVDVIEDIAGTRLRRNYDRTAAQGVRGRNSDNFQVRRTLDWSPSVPLRVGLEATFAWIYHRIADPDCAEDWRTCGNGWRG